MLHYYTVAALGWLSSTQQSYDIAAETLEKIIESNGAINRIWDLPEDDGLTTAAGLRSGITYAWDPEICTRLLPSFGFELWGLTFTTCSTISAAMTNSFNSWSACRATHTQCTTPPCPRCTLC